MALHLCTPPVFYGISKKLMTDINCKDGWTLQYEIVSCTIGIRGVLGNPSKSF